MKYYAYIVKGVVESVYNWPTSKDDTNDSKFDPAITMANTFPAQMIINFMEIKPEQLKEAVPGAKYVGGKFVAP